MMTPTNETLTHKRVRTLAQLLSRRCITIISPSPYFCYLSGLVLSQTSFEIPCGLNLWLFCYVTITPCSCRGIACLCLTNSLFLVELSNDSLTMSLKNVFRNSLHCEYFEIGIRAIGKRIFNDSQSFFVDLIHVNTEPWHKTLVSRTILRMKVYIPPAVLRRRPHRWHLKCFAFWWLIRIRVSSKSRSQ